MHTLYSLRAVCSFLIIFSLTIASKSSLAQCTVTRTINGISPVCASSSSSQFYTTQSEMTNYAWTVSSGGSISFGGSSSDHFVEIIWHTAGSQTVSVNYQDNNGCTAASPTVFNVTVTTPTVTNTATISGNSTVCEGSTELYTTESGKQFYTWSVSGGTIIGSQANSFINVQWNMQGSRTVSVTYSEPYPATCTNSTTVKSVTVNPPIIGTISGEATVCQGSTYVYTTESGMSNYYWNKSSGTIISGGTLIDNTITIKWDYPYAHYVSVVYLNDNNCTASVSKDIFVNPAQLPTITGATSACESTTNSYTTETGKSNYVWSVSAGGSIISGQATNTVSIQWNSPGTQSVNVSYDAGGICPSSNSQNVTVNAIQVPTITGSTMACIYSTYTYTTQPSIDGYIWSVSPGNTIVSGGDPFSNTMTVLWNSLGNQTISVGYPNTIGCKTTTPTVKDITVNGLSSAPTIFGDADVCHNSTGNVYTTEAGKSNYSWTIPSTGTVTAGGSSVDNYVTITWANPPNMTTNGRIDVSYSENGCAAYGYKDVLINNPSAISGSQNTCQGTTEYYYTQASQSNYIWSVSGGGTITSGGSSADNFVYVNWNSVGSQTVTTSYTSANECTSGSPTVLNVTVNATSVPSITGSSTVCADGSQHSYTTEPGKTAYNWSLSGGYFVSSNNSNTATVVWQESGTISVNTLSGSCWVAAQKNVTVTAPPTPTIAGNTTVCMGSAGNIYITEAGMTNYVWTVSSGATINAGGTSTSNSIDITWNTFGNGNWVSVSYTNANGCTAFGPTQHSVMANSRPVPTIFKAGTSSCLGPSNYSTEAGKTNYIWTVSSGGTVTAGGTSTLNTATVTWNTTGNQTISVNYTDANGCTATQPTVDIIPVNSPTISNLNGCLGAGNQYATDAQKSNYVWAVSGGGTITGGGTSTDNLIIVTWNTTGSQTVSVKYTTHDCTPISPTVWNINVTQTVPTLSGNDTPCLNTIETYTTEAGMSNYAWSVPSGGSITAGGTSTSNTVGITWTATGSRNINVSYTNGENCYGSFSKTINVSPPIITFNPLPAKVYGDASFTPDATVCSGPPLTYASSNTNVATISGNQVTIIGAGNTTIVASQSGPNAAAPVSQLLTVNKRMLTVTADNKSKTYGAANPLLTFAYSGFAGSDNSGVIDVQPTTSTSAIQCSNVGVYPITLAGGSDNNYTLNLINGSLNVNKAPLTITAADKSKIYGAVIPALTLTYSGFVCGDALTVIDAQPTLSTITVQCTNAGSYLITTAGGSDNNYTFIYVNGTMTVNKALLTVIPNAKSRPYGSLNPPLDYTYSGLVCGDAANTIDAPPTISTTAIQCSNAGSYSITPAGGSDNNYTFMYTNGTLTVTKAVLTVTGNNISKVYGTANPALSISFSGFACGDAITVLDLLPSVSTSAIQCSNAGSYSITPEGGSDNNYTFTYLNGTLTVTKATLTATADNKSKTWGANQPLTLSYSGFVCSDIASAIDNPPIISSTATQYSCEGTYSITPSGGSDNNYQFTYTSGTLTISQLEGAQSITTVAGTYFEGNSATRSILKSAKSVAVDGSGNIYIVSNEANLDYRIQKVNASNGILTTIAGNGTQGSSGDGGLAINAMIYPWSIAVDASGNIYFSEGSRIRKINAATGILSTVAGNGTPGFTGDNGLATGASIETYAIALDGSGNIYLGGSPNSANNNRIRKVDITTGIITTAAGNGTAGFSGDGGLATSASLYNPNAIAVDGSGNIYFYDYYNGRIRKVTASTGIISTIAGIGLSGYTGDGGLAINARVDVSRDGLSIDANGNIYLSQSTGIRKITASSGIINTIAGNGLSGFSGDGGPATNASLSSAGLALDGSSNIYLADNNRIRKITVSTGIINTVAGGSADGGLATNTNLFFPADVTLDASKNIYIADQRNYRIRKVDASTGFISTIVGNGSYSSSGNSGDGGQGVNASIFPSNIALDASENIYIASWAFKNIRKVNISTGIITTIGGNGTSAFSGDGGPATSASFAPGDIAIDGSGNTYIADYTNNRIRKITASTGIISTIAGTGTASFSGDGGPATSAAIKNPIGVTLDASGNIYIADYGNQRIRKITTSTGIITTVAGGGTGGDGGLATNAGLGFDISAITVDPLGNIYIVALSSVKRIDASSGIITTIAGNGTNSGFNCDGSPATSTSLYYASGLFTDQIGSVYIADKGNDRVRKIQATQTITYNVLPTKTYGDSPFTLTATASSGLPVTYTSSNTAVATVSGNQVTIVGAGTTNITASQAGNTNYNAAPSVTQTLTVSKANPSVSFTSTNSGTYGGTIALVVNKGGSTGAVTYSVTNGTGSATLSDSDLAFTGAGAVTVTANVAADANYNAATATQTVTINKATPAISFTSPNTGTYGSTIALSVNTGGSTGAVTYSVSNGTGTATVSGGILSLTGAGSVTVTANVAADANYNAATATQTVTINKATPAVTITSPSTGTYGQSVTLTASTGGSTGAITYSVVNGTGGATVSGSALSLTGGGTVTVNASVAADANYAAGTGSQTFTVNKADQIISFGSLTSKTVGDVFTVSASASSNLSVLFESLNTDKATVSGNSVTTLAPGLVNIKASQPGNANYNAAPDVVQSFTIYAVPVAEINGAITYCGSDIILLGSTNTNCTYLWSTGHTTQNNTVTGQGDYWLRVTNAAGYSVTSTTHTITDNRPSISVSGPTSLCPSITTTLTSSLGASYQWYRNGGFTGQTSPSINVSLGGTYYVRVTDPIGCTGTLNAPSITIESPYGVSITGHTTFCQGNHAELNTITDCIGCTYSWSNGATNAVQWVYSPGEYTVTVTKPSTGCAISADVEVFQIQNTNGGYISSSASCYNNSPVVLAANPKKNSNSYAWFKGNTSLSMTSQTISVTSLGNYNATITTSTGSVKRGCFDLYPCFYAIMALPEEGDDTEASMESFPNPANRELIIQLPTAVEQQTRLQLFDQMGRMVEQTYLEKGEFQKIIKTSGYTAGVYIIQIDSPKGILRRRVMVVHHN